MAAVEVSVVTDLPRVGARIASAPERFHSIFDFGLARIEEYLKVMARDAIRDVTPVESGDLQGSTFSEGENDGETLTVTVHQPREVTSSVNSWILAQLLIEGHDIVTKDRRVVGYYDPHPYNEEARATMETETADIVSEESRVMLRELAAALK